MKPLDKLQSGDLVIETRYHPLDRKKHLVRRVDRVTKTQIIINGRRFRRDTGYLVGKLSYNRYSQPRISSPSEAELLDVRRENVRLDKICRIREKWEALDKTLESCSDDRLDALHQAFGCTTPGDANGV